MTTPRLPAVGLAVSTVGRPTLHEMLRSAAASEVLPAAVGVADHTPAGDLALEPGLPFPAVVVPSTGGASAGRNHAVAGLPVAVDVLGFPNDDNRYPPETLGAVAAAFAAPDAPAAVACTALDGAVPRFRLPPDGAVLDRYSVWRAFEPAMFVQRRWFEEVSGFPEELGTGAATPWQSGDGTEMLLRIMARGGRVVSLRSAVVHGRGERKGLSADGLVAKHRAYARGTGYVYRVNDYPTHRRLMVALAPLLKALEHDPDRALSLRIALARTLGRVEGLTGHLLPGSGRAG